jgi:hypothetical protein
LGFKNIFFQQGGNKEGHGHGHGHGGSGGTAGAGGEVALGAITNRDLTDEERAALLAPDIDDIDIDEEKGAQRGDGLVPYSDSLDLTKSTKAAAAAAATPGAADINLLDLQEDRVTSGSNSYNDLPDAKE